MNQSIKRALVVAFVLIFSVSLKAQSSGENPCYFDPYTNNHSIRAAEKIIQAGVEKLKNSPVLRSSQDSIKVIPVVIHVIHRGGSENISEAQIQSQIDIMNEDYGKIPGSNGDGAGVDTKVRFCLAKIDPNGNCTNGIVRINSPLTDHKTYERAMLKELSFWDNTKYMNIYLVRTITGGVLGYSSFPGGPPEEDGMVVRSDVFGNTGTASSSLGRTASHEIGHWFGLYHTFNNGCGTDVCTDGDFVCDTPPQAAPSFNCSVINSCSNDVPDVDDQKENYMNYTPDACKNMFTNGQKLRIHSTLENIRTTIWSQSNLIATGCDSNYTAPAICPVTASFVTLTTTVCEGNDARFMDISLNNPTSWQWSFPGGSPTTSTLQNPTVTYNTAGTYPVTLVVADSLSSDSYTVNNYIEVTTPGTGIPLPFYEDFESGVFPPQGITIVNYDGGITWEHDSNASVSGNYSVRINNLINTNYGSADEIVLPYLDFTAFSGGPNLFMTFEYAYARSDPSFSDEMIVLLSKDCGVTFKQVFYRTGNGLATGPTQTTPFIPDSSQWRTATVFLTQYITEPYVQLKIVNVTDGGNNLYIDDINIGDYPVGIKDITENNEFTVYPNPANDQITLNFPESFENKIIRMYNSVGGIVLTAPLNGRGRQSIAVGQLPAGIYYLTLQSHSGVVAKKIIITR